MALIEKAKRTKLILLVALLVAGASLTVFPVSAQENLGQPYTTPPNYWVSGINTQIGFAPPGYFATAHISSGNPVTVTLTLVESDSQLFQATFPAGTFDIPNIPMGQSSGTVFLAIRSQGNVITSMSVLARIFHEITAFPLFWAGLGVLGLAGIYAVASFHKEMGLGRILPVDKLGLFIEFETLHRQVPQD